MLKEELRFEAEEAARAHGGAGTTARAPADGHAAGQVSSKGIERGGGGREELRFEAEGAARAHGGDGTTGRAPADGHGAGQVRNSNSSCVHKIHEGGRKRLHAHMGQQA